MNINQKLNEDCFMEVFARLEPSDLLLIRRVCPLWCHYSEKVCRTKTTLSISNHADYPVDKLEFYGFDCGKHKALKTAGNFDLVVKYGENEKVEDGKIWKSSEYNYKHGIEVSDEFQLKLDTEQDGKHFAKLFPNLTSLAITNYGRESTDILVSMLSQWPRLVNLKIIGKFDWPMLRDSIGHLTKLRYLSISVCVRKLSQLANVQQLNEFYCKYGFCRKGDLLSPEPTDQDSILNGLIAEDGKIAQFGLYYFSKGNSHTNWTTAVATRLVRLGRFVLLFAFNNWLESLALKCPAITYLDVRCLAYGENLFRQLNCFKNVVVFKVDFSCVFTFELIDQSVVINEFAQVVEFRGIRDLPHLVGRTILRYFPAATKMAYRVSSKELVPDDGVNFDDFPDYDEAQDNVPICEVANCESCRYVNELVAGLDCFAVHDYRTIRFELGRDGVIRGHEFVCFDDSNIFQ